MIIAVPEILRERFGPEATQALVELLNQLAYKTRDDIVLLAEERFARRVAEAEVRFEHRLADLQGHFEHRFADLQGHLEHRLAGTDHRLADFESRLERRLTDVIRWMVGLWILGIGTLLSVLFTFFRP